MNDIGKLILRLGFGGLMLPHGYPKLQRLIEQQGDVGFSDPFGAGPLVSIILTIFAELICPILILIGWKTRWFAIPPAIVMLVAAFVIHGDDPWSKQELPLLFLTGFIALAFLGSGKWSLDKK